MRLQNLEEAEAALSPYVPLVGRVKPGTTLDRVWPLMELLGNPQDKLKIVHVAGTSGKTSTAYYMSALLTAAGQKTGLTVSPHVDSLTERVQINGQSLSETEFCELLGEFLDIVQAADQWPSYFELLYAFALWIFARQGVDYAVVETGMGGLFDATNVAQRTDKVCIITDIGFDHTHILGKTLTEITTQKAGIIHDGNEVFMYSQADEIMAVIKQQVKVKKAGLHIVPATEDEDYLQRNWRLAQATFEFLVNRDNLQHLTRQSLVQTQAVQVPARMEVRTVKGKTVVMDGAHNAQKMTAFVDSFRRHFPEVKPAVLLALKDSPDKDYQAVAPILAPLAARAIVTTFQTTQDLPSKSIDPELIAEAFREVGVDVKAIPDQAQAVSTLLAAAGDVVVITGSFYLLSQIRNNGLV
jgi:dihydrofolate synthase/folylpolyglutamate synthase